MGTAYEALRAVAQLDRADLNDGQGYQAARLALQECSTKVKIFLKNPGLKGAAGVAASEWLRGFDLKLQARIAEMSQAELSFGTADWAMKDAKTEYSRLSPELVSPWEAIGIRAAGSVVLFPLGTVTAEYYLSQLREQRDAQRDAEAQRILNTMNAELARAVNQLPTVTGDGIVDPGDAGDTETPGTPGTPVRTGGSPGDGGPGRVKLPGIILPPPGGVNPPPMYPLPVDPTPVLPKPWPPTKGPGSLPNPIGPGDGIPLPDLPERPINQRWTSDGPVGGYVPAPVLNADDPRWGANFRAAGFGDAAGGVGIAAGGLLGLGATALAARSAGSALSGGAALAFGSASGSGSAAALTGAGGAQAAGAAGRVPGNGMLGGAAGGGAPGQDKKRRSGLVGYQVQRLDEQAPQAATPGLAGAAGSVAGLAPITEVEEVDRW